MSVELTRYSAAKKALAEAQRIDEVKDIRDKATAMRIYAMQARDRVLIDHATEIRLRAERRAGEMLRETEKNKGARGNGRPKIGGLDERPPKDPTPTLRDLDINKSQSSRWQKLAEMDEQSFEDVVGRAKEKAGNAIDRAQQPKPKPRRKPPKRDAADITATCIAEVESIVRAAVVGMDSEERAGLAEQLENAIRAIMSDAAARDSDVATNGAAAPADHDRWCER